MGPSWVGTSGGVWKKRSVTGCAAPAPAAGLGEEVDSYWVCAPSVTSQEVRETELEAESETISKPESCPENEKVEGKSDEAESVMEESAYNQKI